LIRLWESR